MNIHNSQRRHSKSTTLQSDAHPAPRARSDIWINGCQPLGNAVSVLHSALVDGYTVYSSSSIALFYQRNIDQPAFVNMRYLNIA